MKAEKDNKIKFNIGKIPVFCSVVFVTVWIFAIIVFVVVYAIGFEKMSLAVKVAIPISVLIMTLTVWLVVWFSRLHCVVTDNSFIYKAMNYLRSWNSHNSSYEKYVLPKEETVKNGEIIKFENVVGIEFYQVIDFKFGLKYLIFVMNDGKRKCARMDSFSNSRIFTIIDEIIKHSNGAIKDMRRIEDIIDLRNSSILIK